MVREASGVQHSNGHYRNIPLSFDFFISGHRKGQAEDGWAITLSISAAISHLWKHIISHSLLTDFSCWGRKDKSAFLCFRHTKALLLWPFHIHYSLKHPSLPKDSECNNQRELRWIHMETDHLRELYFLMQVQHKLVCLPKVCNIGYIILATKVLFSGTAFVAEDSLTLWAWLFSSLPFLKAFLA